MMTQAWTTGRNHCSIKTYFLLLMKFLETLCEPESNALSAFIVFLDVTISYTTKVFSGNLIKPLRS